MKIITMEDQAFIRQIASYHVQMLQHDPLMATQSHAMACALYEEMIQRRIDLNGDYIEAIVEDDKVNAYIWGHHDASSQTVTIESLYVSPNVRHKGVATILKQHIETWAIHQQARQIVGTVLENNDAMRALNEKLGYSVQKVVMQKMLKYD